jgi:hypothetical protein
VHVVTTCTDRKTRIPSEMCRAKVLPAGDVPSRLAVWTARLEGDAAPIVPVSDLYAGDHWTVVRSIAALGSDDLSVRVWTCSAGLGLVPWDASVPPYSATFNSTHPDAVVPSSSRGTSADWWAGLATWQPIWPLARDGEGRTIKSLPRTLDALGQTLRPDDFLLIAVSAAYLKALRQDLARLANSLSNDRWAIIASGAGSSLELPALIPTSARLKGEVGGAMQSLNARLARRALVERASWFPSRFALAMCIKDWELTARPTPSPVRVPTSDGEVQSFIADRRRQVPGIGHSTLLRELRDSGRACEQARFAALFRRVVEVTSGIDGTLGGSAA